MGFLETVVQLFTTTTVDQPDDVKIPDEIVVQEEPVKRTPVKKRRAKAATKKKQKKVNETLVNTQRNSRYSHIMIKRRSRRQSEEFSKIIEPSEMDVAIEEKPSKIKIIDEPHIKPFFKDAAPVDLADSNRTRQNAKPVLKQKKSLDDDYVSSEERIEIVLMPKRTAKES
jgi:hypothetical protein